MITYLIDKIFKCIFVYFSSARSSCSGGEASAKRPDQSPQVAKTAVEKKLQSLYVIFIILYLDYSGLRGTKITSGKKARGIEQNDFK